MYAISHPLQHQNSMHVEKLLKIKRDSFNKVLNISNLEILRAIDLFEAALYPYESLCGYLIATFQFLIIFLSAFLPVLD